jgi:hypothetical protein
MYIIYYYYYYYYLLIRIGSVCEIFCSEWKKEGKKKEKKKGGYGTV